jgi:hypothetical protein
MGLRPTLHPFTQNGKTYIPAAYHMISPEDKTNFLKVVEDVRVPNKYASNIFRCVRLKDCTIFGLKSHDSHVLMQQLLSIALKGSNLPSNVVMPLIGMCIFFRRICSTTLDPEDLNRLERRNYYFIPDGTSIPPSYFSSIVHVVVHLVHECCLRGPVKYK